ncbi:phage terminase large subunit family protein [Agrobacterium genomosp. 3]|nr:phage terminase large subunit family protein [Agrobacterium tomkonis]MCA1879339.1 phage terminase large subunit family protein [Agrobacterium tumefaciens]
MRTFCQQDLAEPYDPGGVTVEWEKIVEAARDEMLPARKIPSWAALVVSAADVQGYGIKWLVYAIGPRDQMQLIDREIFEGPPDQSDEPWIMLSDAQARTYPTENGKREKGIDLSGVDSGWATDRVYRYCAGRPNVFPLDGREPIGLPWLGTPVKKDIKDHRKRVVAKVLLYPVGLYDVKTAVTAALANLVQGRAENGQWPRNTIHFGTDLCDEEFAKELTAERLVDADEEARASVSRRARRLIKPKAGRQWKKIVGRVNDWFDATVYAYALAWYLQNKRRLTLDRWADLVRDLHGDDDEPTDLFEHAEQNPFVKQKPKPDKTQTAGPRPPRRKWKSYS